MFKLLCSKPILCSSKPVFRSKHILCIKLLLLLRSGLRVVFVSAIPSLDFLDYNGGHLATQPVHVPSPLSAYWTAVPLWSSGDTSCSNPTRLSVLPWTAMVVIRQHIVFGSSPSLAPWTAVPWRSPSGDTKPASHVLCPVWRFLKAE